MVLFAHTFTQSKNKSLMSKKRDISPEERALFRDSLGNVRRHNHDRVIHVDLPKPPIRRRTVDCDHPKLLVDDLSDYFDLVPVESDDVLSFIHPGVQKKVMSKLKRGQYRLGDELDLHGYTSGEARPVLAHFLQRAIDDGIRCVRVIHGKGDSSKRPPVIKNKVNGWLRQSDQVLAFCSAKPEDGGVGALYVLLRRGQ